MTLRSIVTPETRPSHAPLDAPRARRRRTSAGVFALALVAASFTVPVAAPRALWGADNGDPAKAEDLIRQANDLRRRGRDGQALPLYRKAYEIARSARTAGQLGLAEMALGYWLAAEGHLGEALAESRNPWVEKTRSVLEQAQKVAQSHLAELKVEGQPGGAEVLINGTVVGTLPLQSPLRLNEGRINLEVRAPGRRSMERTLTLAGRASERVQVALEREEKADPGVAATPSRTMLVSPGSPGSAADGTGGASGPGRTGAAAANQPGQGGDGGQGSRATDGELPTWRRVLPWSLLGVAALAGGIGVWQQLGSRDAQTSFDAISACGASLPDRGGAQCQTYYDEFETKRTRAYVGYTVAGVLAAGAITMFIVNASSGPPASTASAVAAPTAYAFVSLAPGGGLLSYGSRF